MKTAEEYLNGWRYDKTGFWIKSQVYDVADRLISERDKEWTQKIQDALDKETNWDFQVKLKELLK